MNRSYEIVTDTAADIPWNALDKEEITVVPMPMTLMGKPFAYNGVMHPADACKYYRQLHEGASSMTAQVPPSTYREVFEQAFQRDHDVLYVGFSSGMSGSYQNALGAASALETAFPSRRAVCVDSLLATVAQTMLLLYAIANRRQGMTLVQNADCLIKARHDIWVYFIVEDMSFLLRGGRITKSQALLSHAIHIRPLMRINEAGALTSVEKVRGANRALRALADHATEKCGNRKLLFFIGHCDAPDRADELMEVLKSRHTDSTIWTFPVNPVIGCHTGPQMLALACCGQPLADQIRLVLTAANK
ncbi:MAG: DegV family protein [Eubacteriales bacterium]|nr:DegV family protein [Eubacteriales bacterium]